MTAADFHSSVEVVTAAYDELPFSEFLHHPAAVADRLNNVRGLRLRRRGATDLALTRADQLERDGLVVDFTARLLASLIRDVPAETLRQVLTEALPWTTFLPAGDVDRLLTEVTTVAQAAASLDNLSPLASLLTQWRHTAELHADPALLDLVTREPEGDLGPVPFPGGGE
jgi:hypothetical protein